MSLRGNINKTQKSFGDYIKATAMKNSIDQNGALIGTRKYTGYVCRVHGFDEEEDEDLRGTVDVQQHDHEPGDDGDYVGVGHHEGVKCSAIQGNVEGVYLMPSLFSEVTFVQDPSTLEEYVIAYSHVDTIHLQSHRDVSISVVETEEVQEAQSDDDDVADYDECKKTGKGSGTSYSPDHILHTVKTKDDEVTVEQTATEVIITVKESVIKVDTEGNVTINAKNITINGKAKTTIDGTDLIREGKSNLDGNGGFCGIPVCPFTNAVHVGSKITKQ